MSTAEELVDTTDGPELFRLAARRIGVCVRDRWHLDEVLGVGGTAAVYAATHRNGKRVALKMLHPHLSAMPEMRQRFLDEAYVANRIQHPGAVSIIDDDSTEHGEVFLVMDLLEGETLERHAAESGPLAPARVLAIIDELLDILAVAHDEGIVHRDVKPANIFLGRDGQIRLLDFGIARVTASWRTHTTQSGATLGTPAFMPPEQARGRWEQLDARADLWAVGATMFVLLSGRNVHEAETLNEELLAAMTIPAPTLGCFASQLPKALIELVDKALAFEREDRWSSAREMQSAVRRVTALIAAGADSSRKNEDAADASAWPTLVTPSLAPAASSLRALPVGPGRRSLLVALGAAASVLVLGVTRELAQGRNVTVAASVLERPKPAAHEPPRPIGDVVAPGPAEDSRAISLTPDPPTIASIAAVAPAVSAVALPRAALRTVKPAVDGARPPATSAHPSEPTRNLSAALPRDPAAPPSRERVVPPPQPADPLDRRK
jgi:serine/threonine-protein kinase